ncbi:MAG: asparagine synthase-related protein [Nitrososphaerales archaeon]|jgi:asparagine synthase (glutamine-hydrolysing)
MSERMRTNGFAVYRGPGARSSAEGAAARVGRYGRRVELLEDPAPWGAGPDVVAVLAHSLEGSGTGQLVHGFWERPAERGPATGEFAFVSREGGRVLAGRDAVGTRALYVDDGFSCVASDHRLLPRGSTPAALPRGTTVDLVSGERLPAPAQAPKGAVRGFEEEADALGRLLVEAVARRATGARRVAVSFSGGLDSSLVAMIAARHAEVVLCSAFAEGSADQARTARAAALLGLEHHGVVLGRDELGADLRALDLPFAPGSMDRALWCLYSCTSRTASENGAGMILLGQLADELFGGYMKYAVCARESAPAAVAMMEGDVASAERGFLRDELACSRFAEVRFPFADQAVVDLALALPLSYKIRGDERKAILRMAARRLGLPDELASAPKKAAQYSSGLSKLVG